MHGAKKNTLHFVDFIVLSIIFFGYATYQSLNNYFSADTFAEIPRSENYFTNFDNITTLILEVFLLLIAGIYLYFRKFDVKSLNFSVTKSTFPLILLLIIVGAIVTDIGIYGHYFLFPPEAVPVTNTTAEATVATTASFFNNISVWLILFALMNGFFEETFFMGLVFAVKENQRIYAIVGSILVRFGFHIYQGIPSAVGITLMGIAFILIRQRVKSIVPFALAHSFFDVFGASLYYWVYMLYYG